MNRQLKNINNLTQNSSIRLAIKNKLKILERDPQKVFSLLSYKKRIKINYITKLIDKRVTILTGDDMKKELEINWKYIFSSRCSGGNLEYFLKNTPKIPAPSFKPDFSAENIIKIVKNKKNSAPGNTETSWHCIKNAPDIYIDTISKTLSHLYENNFRPSKWSNSKTILLEKDTKDIGLDKFRPISLLPVEYKLFTHILNETLIKELSLHNIIPLSQNGFFPNRGSDQCIHTFLNIINDAISKDRELNCLFIDFEKAFDSVEHWAIKAIFDHINLGKLGEVVHACLLNSFTIIETAEGPTDLIPFERGTKQGDIISPTIFIIFIAPLLWTLEKEGCGYKINNQNITNLTIADDILLISELISDVMKQFNITKQFTDITKINIKPLKSASAYRKSAGFIPSIGNAPFKNLGERDSYRYLGLWINLSLDWSAQLKISRQVFKATMNNITNKIYLGVNLLIKLINQVAVASLEYRMQFVIFDKIWINKLQNWAIREICKLKKIFDPKFSPQFWCIYRGLKNFRNTNLTIFINCLYKILNKPQNIAYISTLSTWGPYLNNFPVPPPPSLLPLTTIKETLSMIQMDILNTAFIRNIAQSHPVPLPRNTLAALSETYKTNLTNRLLTFPPPLPPAIPSPPFKSLTFPDGAVNFRNKTMRTGIASNAKAHFPNNFSPIGPVNTTEAEIQGIEYIIHLFINADGLYIFSDSLSAITLLFEFKKYSLSKQLKTTNRASLRRIFDLLTRKNLSLTTTLPPLNTHALPENKIFLGHIHSHMDNNAEKREKFLQQNTIKYGEYTKAIIEGNARADSIASQNLRFSNPTPSLLLMEGNDSWQLTNRLNEEAIYEPCRNVIAEALTKIDREKFEIEAPSFSKRLLDPSVSMEYTTILLNSYKPKHALLGDFVHKLINKSLPTKCRLRNYADSVAGKNIHPAKKAKIIKAYGDTFCEFCKSENKRVEEDSAHIFSHCPLGKETNDKTTQDIAKLLAKQGLGDICLPFWFSAVQSPFLILDEADADLASFPKGLGDLGYIPKALSKWCRSHLPKDHHALAKKITIIVQKGAHTKWNKRCEQLFKKKSPLNTTNPIAAPITPIFKKS